MAGREAAEHPVSAASASAASWPGLLRCGGSAALASVGLILIQLAVFAVWPPVHTVTEVYRLMTDAPVLGLLSLDVLYLVNNLAVWVFYLGLCGALWEVSRSACAMAMGLGTLQMAAYFSSNPALEMFTLARAHAGAPPEARPGLMAAGEALLVGWKGTAFVTYYLLGAVVLLILTWLLWRSRLFGRTTAWWALAAGVLMLVPSPFGTPGMIFALASLLPWSVLCLLTGTQLLRLASGDHRAARPAAGTSPVST